MVNSIRRFFLKGHFTNGLLIFIIALILTALCALTSVYIGAFAPGSISKVLCSDKVCNAVYEETMKSEHAFAIPNGVSDGVFDEVFTKENVSSDMRAYSQNIIMNTSYEMDTGGYKEQLVKNVREELKSKSVKLTSYLKKDIDTFADECISIYVDKITIPYVDKYITVKGYAKIACAVAAVSLVLCVGIIILILGKICEYAHRLIRYLSYTCGAVGFVGIVVCACVFISRIIYKLQLQPANFKFIIQGICKNVLTQMVVLTAVFVLLCAAFAVLSEVLRSRFVKKVSRGVRAPAGFHQGLIDFIEDTDVQTSHHSVKPNKGKELNVEDINDIETLSEIMNKDK